MRIHLNLNTVVLLVFAFLVLVSPGRSTAEALDTFHWRNPLPTGNGLGDVAFGGGKFVAIDYLGHFYSSTDGLAWTRQLSPSLSPGRAIAYGNGRFVSVCYSGEIVSSEGDGLAVHDSGAMEILTDVAYGNGWFVVVNNGGGVTRSSDGVTWTHQDDVAEAAPHLHEVDFGNGVFVAIDHRNTALVSVDGAHWTAHTISDPADSHTGLLYAFDKFYVRTLFSLGGGGHGAATYSSTDGMTWTRENDLPLPTGAAAGSDLVALLTIQNEFRSPTYGLATSTDGQTWVARDPANQATLRSIAYGNGLFVAVGEQGEVVRSTNGINWTRVSGDRNFTINAGVYHNGKYVLVGDTILLSSNGRTFTRVAGPVEARDVTQGGGVFVMVGAGGQIMRSSDSVTWLPTPSGTSRTLHGIAYGGGIFVAVGDAGVIRLSADGVVWEGAWSTTDHALKDVVYAQNQFIAVGNSGTILASPDGVDWAPRPSGDFNSLEGVAFGNGQFTAVGSSTVLASPDGETWIRHPVALSYSGLKGIAFGAGTFVVRGSDGDYLRGLFSSSDGEQWTQRLYGTDYSITGMGFLNDTFMLFGYNGMILQSDPLEPVRLAGFLNAAAGDFEVTITGIEIGRVYAVQASADLAAGQWEDVVRFTATQRVTKFVISSSPDSPQKFYRVASQ